MTTAEAQAKICPFQSIPSYEPPPPHTNIIGITMPYHVYCSGNTCMAWQGVISTNELEGYCKLIEQQFPEG